MPTTLFTATHVLTAAATVLPPALTSAFVVRYVEERSAVVEAQKQNPRQGASAKRLPTTKSDASVAATTPSSPSTPAKLSELNTMQCITIPLPHRRELTVIRAIADMLMDPPRSRPEKPSSPTRYVPVRLLQVARQSNLTEHYYCQPAYALYAVCPI